MHLEFLAVDGKCDCLSEWFNPFVKNAFCSADCAKSALGFCGCVRARDPWWDTIFTNDQPPQAC